MKKMLILAMLALVAFASVADAQVQTNWPFGGTNVFPQPINVTLGKGFVTHGGSNAMCLSADDVPGWVSNKNNAVQILDGWNAVQDNTLFFRTERVPVVLIDTNAVMVPTGYTPMYYGDILIGTVSNEIWISYGLTSNEWVRIDD